MTTTPDTLGGPLRIEVVHAANVQVGDWFAGIVNPDAPTTPAQPAAAALRITSKETVDGPDGKRVHLACAIGNLTPHRIGVLCLVIRGERVQ